MELPLLLNFVGASTNFWDFFLSILAESLDVSYYVFSNSLYFSFQIVISDLYWALVWSIWL